MVILYMYAYVSHHYLLLDKWQINLIIWVTLFVCHLGDHFYNLSSDEHIIPEDHWSCIAHLSAEDMLKSVVTKEKK